MSSRPSNKRAARSSFEVPQIPTHRLKLDRPDLPACIDQDPPRSVVESREIREDIDYMHARHSDHQNTTNAMSEYPFPQQYPPRPADALQTATSRLTIDTARTANNASWQMRSGRTDSWASDCSPLSYVSPMPSLASSDPWSPLSTTTPSTPASFLGSVTNSLQQTTMAEELSMTLEEIKEMDDFAALSVSGSEKRSGRVLPNRVHRPIRLSRSSTESRRFSRRSSIRSSRNGSLPSGRPRLQSIEEWTNRVDTDVETKDWWREVNWSRFSDSSSSSMSDGDMDTLPDQPTQRPAGMSRRRSSYRGCIFLPPNHEHKLPYRRDDDMEAESLAEAQGSIEASEMNNAMSCS